MPTSTKQLRCTPNEGEGARVLYHYSTLLYLPPILREGLTRGEIPHPDPRHLQHAVSLTTQVDPDSAAFWGKLRDPSDAFKLGVRHACRLAVDDPKLEPAVQTWRRMRFTRAWVRAFDPYGQSKWWSHYHGVIPPTAFSVELRGRTGYVPVSGTALQAAAGLAEVALKQVTFITDPFTPAVKYLRLRPDADERLVFEKYPADRLGLVRK